MKMKEISGCVPHPYIFVLNGISVHNKNKDVRMWGGT